MNPGNKMQGEMMPTAYLTLFIAILFLNNVDFGNGKEALEEAPTVKVNQGRLKGIKEKTLKSKEFYSYKSIPFALPPIGDLRFKAPVPMSSWTGTLNATEDPAFCIQKLFDVKNITDSKRNVYFYAREDCLYLNIHTPKVISDESKYPVMVFIHGGLWIMGGAPKMQPYILMDEDIILVVIQFRLGIFGFLSTEDSVLPGNMGLKDQQLALQWIKENIASFGGDSDKITIFGHSVGGSSVHFHILSPSSKGLFHRAIMQSGTALAPYAVYNNHKKYAEEVGKHFGCSLNDGTKKYLLCMQNIEASELLDFANSKLLWGQFAPTNMPRVDRDFLPDFPENLMREGNYNKVDMIAGGVKNEAVYVLQTFYKDPTTLEDLNTEFDVYGPVSLFMENEPNATALALKAYQYYLQREDINVSLDDEDSLLDLYSDRLFQSNLDLTLQFFKDQPDSKLYVYQFDYLGEFRNYDSTKELLGKQWVAHGDELLYLFGGGPLTDRKLKSKEDLEMSEIMVSAWTNFARTGNPTPPGSNFNWEKATIDDLRMSLTVKPKSVTFNRTAVGEFWLSLDTMQNRLLNNITKIYN